ncbi:MAG TPA: hypothetical protein VG367_10400 [Mucilaginibacter sp.]|jgi:hypothetical protein|nr:hypothetical protein [Mucilaginibacter sp.]
MKSFSISLLIILVSVLAKAQSQIDIISSYYKQGKFDQVIISGEKYRRTLNGRGIPALDYMILTSICLNPPNKSLACKLANIITDDYYQGLDKADISLIKNGFSAICNGNNSLNYNIVQQITTNQYAHDHHYSGIFGSFKSYMAIGSLGQENQFKYFNSEFAREVMEKPIISNKVVKTLNNTDIETLINRRCKKGDNLAIGRMVTRFGKGARYYVSNNFLVITSAKNPIEPKGVCMDLENVLAFYNNYYSLNSPSDLIVIYLTSKYDGVGPLVKRLYGIQIPFGGLGYSNFYDNSITAWIYDNHDVGTLKHELIHILIKSTFNNIPHWFEEGLAELYEESTFTDKVLIGKENWRFALLKENVFDYSYSLNDLIHNLEYEPNQEQLKKTSDKFLFYIKKNESPEFFNGEQLEIKAAIPAFISSALSLYKDALSRYFILYLQDTKKLKPLYYNLQKRDSAFFDLSNYKSIENIISESCGERSFKNVEDNFATWLNNQSIKN